MRERENGYEERIMNRDLMRGEKEKERMNKLNNSVSNWPTNLVFQIKKDQQLIQQSYITDSIKRVNRPSHKGIFQI